MAIPKTALNFIGLDTDYLCADGSRRKRIHLDGAASPLAAKAGVDMQTKLLPHYSNTHSYVHNSAQISTKALQWAHQTVLNFVEADEVNYSAVFCGSGTTAAINRIARGLHKLRPQRTTVFISSMEHHANDLPHRQFNNDCIYLPLSGEHKNLGAIDLEQLEKLCAEYADQVNYIAVSSVSNVTGIQNPIAEICEIAHRYGIFVVVDAAQSVAHLPSQVDKLGADFWVFSGHKLYTPSSPGVMIAKRDLLDKMSGQDLGGGSVTDVSFYDYTLNNDTSIKEESGTPNILGAVSLAATMNAIQEHGQASIIELEVKLMQRLITGINELEGFTIYGDPKLPRTAAIAFNHADIEHGLLAAILNDYFCIAVRNECFCAHPYVSSLLKQELWEIDLTDVPEEQHEALVNSRRGMVRTSLSAYNSEQDIDALLIALTKITEDISDYRKFYQMNSDGSFSHLSFNLDWREQLFDS